MASITGMTAEKIQELEGQSITAARIDPTTNHLIFTTRGGDDIDVGVLGFISTDFVLKSDGIAVVVGVTGGDGTNASFVALRPHDSGSQEHQFVVFDTGLVITTKADGTTQSVLDDGAGNMTVAGNLVVGGITQKGGSYYGVGSVGEITGPITVGPGTRLLIATASGYAVTLDTANDKQVVTIRNNTGSGNIDVHITSGVLYGSASLSPGQFGTYFTDGANWFQIG